MFTFGSDIPDAPVVPARVGVAGVSEHILAAYAVAWLLLLSGVVRILQRNIRSDDARRLADSTWLPRFLWFLMWLAGSLIAVAIGGKWLIMRT